eukprot:6519569-Pyramimonas_sp.AAC.1
MSQLKSKTSTYPVLKAKAAQTKHLCRLALALAHRQAGFQTRTAFSWRPGHRLHARSHEYCALITQIFEATCAYYDACDADDFEPERCIQPMYAFLQTMVQMNDLWCHGLAPDLHNFQPFHIRQKMHMLQHLVEDQLSLFGAPKNFS